MHNNMGDGVPERNRPAIDNLGEGRIHVLAESFEEPLMRLNLTLIVMLDTEMNVHWDMVKDPFLYFSWNGTS
jgi:hypothetical protein